MENTLYVWQISSSILPSLETTDVFSGCHVLGLDAVLHLVRGPAAEGGLLRARPSARGLASCSSAF